MVFWKRKFNYFFANYVEKLYYFFANYVEKWYINKYRRLYMEKIRIQDDLYLNVNGEWLEKATIPADKPVAGGFSDLDEGVTKTLIQDFNDLADGKIKTDIKEMNEAVKYFKVAKDEARRNSEGIKPIMPLLNKIKNLKSIKDFNEALVDFIYQGVDLPFQYGVTNDMADATKHSFIVLGPEIILPDTTYYADEATYNQIIGLFSQMATLLLKHTDLSDAEQLEYLQDTLFYDKLIAKSVKSQVEWADYVNNHNPIKFDEACDYFGDLAFRDAFDQVYQGKHPDEIVAYDLRAIKEFKNYFNEEVFSKMVHWMYVRALIVMCRYLSFDLANLSNMYVNALMGVQACPPVVKQAYMATSMVFMHPVGIYYGRKYFGEEAKVDVVNLVKKIIETYKLRMERNNFLEEATKKKAILKLSTIEIKMGYPASVPVKYQNYVVDENLSYFENHQRIFKMELQYEMAELFKPVDRTKWGMPGHMVNASYNPSLNDITFPAAILQAPFYSINQSASQNLGGIGAVIGHEISHAFDNNGAHFDELGNINNWWTEKDFAEFKKLTQAMIEQFDGIIYHGGRVNGELVVSENIADNGGMAVALEIMKSIKDANYQEFFINWAKVWCLKAKEEYIQLLLARDVHSPAGLRANMPPRNFGEWYQAFDVKETDQMYIAKEKRINIW